MYLIVIKHNARNDSIFLCHDTPMCTKWDQIFRVYYNKQFACTLKSCKVSVYIRRSTFACRVCLCLEYQDTRVHRGSDKLSGKGHGETQEDE